MAPNSCNGIDVSHYQGDIDWASVAESGIAFAMMKASEGSTFVDPMFTTNWAGAKQNNILCGAYHFFQPTESFMQQADLFLGLLRDVGYDPKKDLPPAIDCEDTTGCSSSTYAFALGHLLQLLQRFLGVKPMIYTAPGFWASIDNPNFSEYPLWLAEYTEASTPTMPPCWSDCALWQFSDTGNVDGIEGPVDLDRQPSGTLALQTGGPTLNWF